MSKRKLDWPIIISWLLLVAGTIGMIYHATRGDF